MFCANKPDAPTVSGPLDAFENGVLDQRTDSFVGTPNSVTVNFMEGAEALKLEDSSNKSQEDRDKS